jgi:hypothetical protein
MLEPQAVKGRLLVARCLVNDATEGTVRILNPTDGDVNLSLNEFNGNTQPVNFNCIRCGLVCLLQTER